jgi:hypothetical protein
MVRAVLVALMLSTSAYAAEVRDTVLPPAQYDHKPLVPVIEHVLTAEQVDAICHDHHALGWNGRTPPPGYRFYGCAHVTARSCEVWRIDDDRVRRHENGHCSGWPANHTVAVAVAVAPKPAPPWHKEVVALKPWPIDQPDRSPTGEGLVRSVQGRDLIADANRSTGTPR